MLEMIFFVYGTFPTSLNKFLAIQLGNDTYNNLTIQGRVLSALFDLGTLVLVGIAAFLAASLFDLPKRLMLWSTLTYALFVLPIQLAHFFAVDTFLTFGMFLGFVGSLYTYLKLMDKQTDLISIVGGVFIAGLGLGLAIASKINAIVILPLLASIMAIPFWYKIRPAHVHASINKYIVKSILYLLLLLSQFVLTIYIVTRFANPSLFATNNFFDFHINPLFLSNVSQLRQWEGMDVWFPPAIQWQSKTFWFGLTNMVLLGLGIPISMLVVVGLITTLNCVKSYSKHRLIAIILLAWMLGFFVFQSLQFVKALRYYVFLYPFLAIFAGLGILTIEKFGRRIKFGLISVRLLVLILMIAWPLAFISIYIQPHTRLQASIWIYDHLPASDKVVNEHWDDPLPLLLPFQSKQFHGEMLPVFGEDTPQKWAQMESLLDDADYYFVSSNRGWASIGKIPQKYPIQSQFYRDLFEQKTEFIPIAEFTSYPSLHYLGIPFELHDDWLDETFTVYDHPKVLIFAKQNTIPLEQFTSKVHKK